MDRSGSERIATDSTLSDRLRRETGRPAARMRWAAALTIAFLTVAAHGESNLRCEIVAHGLVEFGRSKDQHVDYLSSFAAKSSNHALISKYVKVTTETTEVPLALGMVFGAQLVILGRHPARETSYEVRWTIPERIDPSTGEPLNQTSKVFTKRLGRRNTHLFAFAEEWELIPGPYYIEIWHEQGKLCSQAFNIVDKEAAVYGITDSQPSEESDDASTDPG